jgi:hypothetical protein
MPLLFAFDRVSSSVLSMQDSNAILKSCFRKAFFQYWQLLVWTVYFDPMECMTTNSKPDTWVKKQAMLDTSVCGYVHLMKEKVGFVLELVSGCACNVRERLFIMRGNVRLLIV